MTTQWTLTTDSSGNGRIHGPCQGLDGGKTSADTHAPTPDKVQAIRQWKPGQDVPIAQWERTVLGTVWSGWIPVRPEAIRW